MRMGLINFLKEKFAHRKEEKKAAETLPVSSIPTAKEEPVAEPVTAAKTSVVPSSSEVIPSEAKSTAPASVLSEKEKEKAVEDKYVAGLDKSRVGFTDRLKKLAASHKVVNQEYFDNLERILIEADVGVSLSLELIQETSKEASAQSVTDPTALNDILIDKMFVGYANKGGSFATDLTFASSGPTVVFMTGVNGGGKTTTVAKLAHRYQIKGKKVLLVAGDTFRAGAVEQLEFWAKKMGIDILSKVNADPSSLCYDALNKAKAENYDLVFIDTAGRLQNKKGLMDELSKMIRVIKKVIPDAPHEALLVIDANTGQNGIDQASVFKEACPLTGIVITKMDGTSKGGIILSIRDQLALPVKFIGLGEGMDDLEEFDLDKYLYGLLIGE
jgi:fused signal recognition particle receptor